MNKDSVWFTFKDGVKTPAYVGGKYPSEGRRTLAGKEIKLARPSQKKLADKLRGHNLARLDLKDTRGETVTSININDLPKNALGAIIKAITPAQAREVRKDAQDAEKIAGGYSEIKLPDGRKAWVQSSNVGLPEKPQGPMTLAQRRALGQIKTVG